MGGTGKGKERISCRGTTAPLPKRQPANLLRSAKIKHLNTHKLFYREILCFAKVFTNSLPIGLAVQVEYKNVKTSSKFDSVFSRLKKEGQISRNSESTLNTHPTQTHPAAPPAASQTAAHLQTALSCTGWMAGPEGGAVGALHHTMTLYNSYNELFTEKKYSGYKR